MNELKEYNISIFESIKHIDDDGNEYWYARELQKVLEYKQWRRFEEAINKAMVTCKNSNVDTNLQFAKVGKLSNMSNGGTRKILDYKLSRYACYLIVMNGDSRKEVIALGQTYFAIQTRRQELLEKEYELMSEDEKRLYQRNLTRKGNYSLNQTAKKSGVKNFDKFHNAGYKGLYNGETADDIAKRKGLRYREDILDNMGSEELVDNLFRIVQTEAKLKRDSITSESSANKIHYEVGKGVRETIKKFNGTMPEDLPKPDKSLKEIEKDKQINNDYDKYIDLKIQNLKDNDEDIYIYLMALYGENDIKYKIKISSELQIDNDNLLKELLENLDNNYEIDDSIFNQKEDKNIKITTYDNRNGKLIEEVWFNK